MKAKTRSIIRWFFVLGFLSFSVLYAFGALEASNELMATIFLCFAWVAYSAKVEMNHNRKNKLGGK